ncbi:hypothetical protein Hamer_G004286 [Homarus americanus]|uniref:Uncharacterized protein n=1 Tax=Homarus americanus TaxID=6706 RepID=A0A8J5JL10_HOMAM|nr:hypothetical protein Hamer_G004286 [Homarus americanus]
MNRIWRGQQPQNTHLQWPPLQLLPRQRPPQPQPQPKKNDQAPVEMKISLKAVWCVNMNGSPPQRRLLTVLGTKCSWCCVQTCCCSTKIARATRLLLKYTSGLRLHVMFQVDKHQLQMTTLRRRMSCDSNCLVVLSTCSKPKMKKSWEFGLELSKQLRPQKDQLVLPVPKLSRQALRRRMNPNDAASSPSRRNNRVDVHICTLSLFLFFFSQPTLSFLSSFFISFPKSPLAIS